MLDSCSPIRYLLAKRQSVASPTVLARIMSVNVSHQARSLAMVMPTISTCIAGKAAVYETASGVRASTILHQ